MTRKYPGLSPNQCMSGLRLEVSYVVLSLSIGARIDENV
jgi:hypothetical protein